jgi:ATP-dependent DNA helicase DinG
MTSWTEAQELFAAHLDGYQDRPEQTALALRIEQALANDETLLAEAGTGTGKSFAALIPAINHARESGQPVVIATATKALQNQLAYHDLPFLKRVVGDFTWTVLKGRSNYVCLAKADELSPGEFLGLPGLREEIESNQGMTGDLDDLLTPIDFREKSKITSGSDDCIGAKDCPFGESCFAERARERAKHADVIVVNHSVLVRDTLIRQQTADAFGLLPAYSALIVDEGHNLAEYTTSALGSDFSEAGLTRFAADVASHLKDPKVSHPLIGAARELFGVLSEVLGKQRNRLLTDGLLVKHQDAFITVIGAINDLRKRVVDERIHGEDKRKIQKKRLARRAGNLYDRLASVLTAESDQLVRWMEKEKRGKTEVILLKYAPLHVGDFLRENYWEKVPSVVLSATLSIKGNFRYTAAQLGMDDFDGFEAGTPFDYPKQSALYIPRAATESNPRGFASPSTDTATWRVQVGETITRLVRAADGRALLLFTNTAAMNEAHESVASRLKDDGYQVLKQGDASNQVLVTEFKADPTSVLFALKSFMEGIDVPGDALRLVIVDKLPFAVPTDVVTQARMQAADAAVAARKNIPVSRAMWDKDGSFNGMQVPGATLVVKQAVGRLIRSIHDEGLAVILDPRLNPNNQGGKSYGPGIVAALPPSRKMASLSDAVAYLEELTARR